MSSSPATPPIPQQAAPVGLTVYRLHRWDYRDTHETELFYSYQAALSALATSVVDSWGDTIWREGMPDSPDGFTDAQVVLLYYGGDGGSGGREHPTVGESFGNGFEIIPDLVRGPEPTQLALRLATLCVLDGDPGDPDIPPVTYFLNAAGLTVAVAPDPQGYPVVRITPDTVLSGAPVAAHVKDPLGPGGFKRTYHVS